MESIIFAVCLFLITLTTLCWLVTPAKKIQEVKDMTNIKETSVLQDIAAQEAAINESFLDSRTEDATIENIPVAQDFQEELINEKPIEEIQNDNSDTQDPKEETSGIDLNKIRTYLLHKHRCIKLKDLPSNFQLPKDIKTYNLRGEQVARLSALEALIAM